MRLMKSRPILAGAGLVALFLTQLLTACSGDLKRIHIEGRIETQAALNPNYEGEPSPVVIRIYQLKTIGAFESADFFSLMENESGVLGEDLIAREELELRPGQSRELKRDFSPDTRYIGVIAAFRDLEKAAWRAFAPLPKKARVRVEILLERLAVHIQVGN